MPTHLFNFLVIWRNYFFLPSFLGQPDSVSNCSQLNHSADTIAVTCIPGFDGGLTQLFTIELRYLRSPDAPLEEILVRNITSSKPEFEVNHLESGQRYEASIFSSNRKGRSTPVILRVSTLKRPSEGKRLATISSGSGKTPLCVFSYDDFWWNSTWILLFGTLGERCASFINIWSKSGARRKG